MLAGRNRFSRDARYAWLLALVLLASLAQRAQAQYRLAGSVFGTGNTLATDGRYRLVGTVGQPLTGPGFNSAFALDSGFWVGSGPVFTSVEQIDEGVVPETFALDQNYPNPFNATTRIAFALPQATPVTLTVFDLLGREVATLIDEAMAPGRYEVAFEAHGLPSGLYLYVIETDGFRARKAMVFVK